MGGTHGDVLIMGVLLGVSVDCDYHLGGQVRSGSACWLCEDAFERLRDGDGVHVEIDSPR